MEQGDDPWQTRHTEEALAGHLRQSESSEILKVSLQVHKPGSDLEEDEDEEEEDVTRVEEGEDLWQTRRDEEAIAKAPAADTAALGEAQVGKVSTAHLPFPEYLS